MKRQELEELGLSKEQIDKVMQINGSDIENAKSVATTENDGMKAEYEALKTQVKERDKQIEQLKGSVGDNEELKKQIEDLQATNKANEKAHQETITKLKIDMAVDKALINAKARNTKAVKALLELGDAKLDDNGEVVGLQDKIKALTQAEDSKFLFDTDAKGFRGVKPNEKMDNDLRATKDLESMTYTELSDFLDKNPGFDLK